MERNILYDSGDNVLIGTRRADIIDHALVTVEYDNGVNAGFSLNMFSPSFTEELVVIGDEGRLKAFEHNDVFSRSYETGLDLDRGADGTSFRMQPRYARTVERSGHHGSTFF